MAFFGDIFIAIATIADHLLGIHRDINQNGPTRRRVAGVHDLLEVTEIRLQIKPLPAVGLRRRRKIDTRQLRVVAGFLNGWDDDFLRRSS